MATKKAASAKTAARPPVKKAAAKPAAAKKAPAKKAAAKKAPAKKAVASAFMKAMTPSAELAAVIGAAALPRTEVTRKLWDYIKSNKLQDATQRTMINADAKLKALFKKAQVSMFEMTKIVSGHLK